MNVHIDAELAESIIQLNSLLDSMWGIAKKVLACAAVVAMAAAAVVAYLGPLVSQRPGEFTLLVLLVLAVGLLAGYDGHDPLAREDRLPDKPPGR